MLLFKLCRVKKLLQKAIEFAEEHVVIPESNKKVTYHSRKTMLFSETCAWAKDESLFDVGMGAFDGAEIAELVGLLIINEVKTEMPDLQFGLYRDDGLAVYSPMSARDIDKKRKKLHQLFQKLDLKITVQFRLTKVDFLDVTFDLTDSTFKPYKKPNDTPIYIHKHSNHPQHIIKQIPKMVENRLTTNSSTETEFNQAAPIYKEALKKSGHRHDIKYQNRNKNAESNTGAQNKKRRQRKKQQVLWYNPPFNVEVKTNIGKQFLRIIDKHFKEQRKDKLNTIFNRHSVKISYSCMPNLKNVIQSHNAKVLSKTNNTGQKKTCNCKQANTCPLQGNCLQNTVVYKATVNTETETKSYIGSTEGSFKQRYYQHKSDMNLQHNKTKTKLTQHIWNCKQANKNYTIKWEILNKCTKYKPGKKTCDLCTTEKLQILKHHKHNRTQLLNTRSELMGKCPHERKYKLEFVKG